MDKVFIIHADARDIAVGATLSREDPKGQLKLVASGSRKLNNEETKLPTTRAMPYYHKHTQTME